MTLQQFRPILARLKREIEEEQAAMTKLRAFHAIRQQMPNGGAILQVSPNGIVSDGMAIKFQFMSQRLAEKALLVAGFKSLGNNQWK